MVNPNFIITTDSEETNFGHLVIEPLAQGFGHTLGNSLRRVLLTSLKGAAVTAVKIGGVRHQFSTLPGLKEDIVELILNIKKIRLKYDGTGPVKMKLSVKGDGIVNAKQIEPGANIQIVNPDQYLCTLIGPKAKLDVEFWVEEGYGYSPFEDRKIDELGVISLDAIFTPITRVNYRIDSTRVGRMTDLDKLILEITTDGTIAPQDALKEAAKILSRYFEHIYQPKEVGVEQVLNTSAVSNEVVKMTIEELDLPTRIVNALRNGGIEIIGDLLSMDPKELVKIKNLGNKSLQIVEEKLKEKGVALPKA